MKKMLAILLALLMMLTGMATAEETSVNVKYWDAYNVEGTALTHQFDIADQRRTTGQAYITVGALEGHVDEQGTCLITSNETYQQYLETQKQLELRKQEADPKVQLEENMSPEAQEVLRKGNEFLVKIRESNDAIPGEEISAKISRMEMIVQKIFERAGEHPEVIPDLKKMMDYYLPMTVKLLDAYEDMDGQPVQGENITASKKEIEETIDTLNIAFEKLLDSIFRDTAWDVSTDISVLHTVLAQEGLTEDDFEKMKQNAEMK